MTITNTAEPSQNLGTHKHSSQRTWIGFFLIADVFIVLSVAIMLTVGYAQSVTLPLATAFAVAVLGFSVFQLRILGIEWTSAPMAYLVYMAIYHLAFVVPAVLFDEFALNAVYRSSIGRYAYWLIDWVYTQGTIVALYLTAIACIGVAIGSVSVTVLSKTPSVRSDNNHNWRHDGLFQVGISVQFFSIFLFTYVLLTRGGVDVLLADYRTFRDSFMSTILFAQANLFLGFGAILTLSGASRGQWRWSVLLFAICAFPLFLSGNRGEVLFPLLTLAILLYRRHIFLPKVLILLGMVAIFILIPIIFQVRSVGISQINLSELSIDPGRASIDFGFTLRPVATVANWILQGEAYLRGASYWLPFERVLSRFLPMLWERGSVLTDTRFVAYQAALRTGSPMGYSVIAEAFYNFSYLGPGLVLSMIGALLCLLHRRAITPLRLALLGVVLLPLVNNVRNAFIFVPGQIFIGLVLVFAAYQRERFIRAKKTW